MFSVFREGSGTDVTLGLGYFFAYLPQFIVRVLWQRTLNNFLKPSKN